MVFIDKSEIIGAQYLVIEPLSQGDRANSNSAFQTDRHPMQGEHFGRPDILSGERKCHERPETSNV